MPDDLDARFTAFHRACEIDERHDPAAWLPDADCFDAEPRVLVPRSDRRRGVGCCGGAGAELTTRRFAWEAGKTSHRKSERGWWRLR